MMVYTKWNLIHPVMQYTGAKDINGVEIYEGDILKNESGRIVLVEWFTSPNHLGWDQRAINNVGSPNEECCLWSTCEVIGNIHENPELIEENKC